MQFGRDNIGPERTIYLVLQMNVCWGLSGVFESVIDVSPLAKRVLSEFVSVTGVLSFGSTNMQVKRAYAEFHFKVHQHCVNPATSM